MILTSDCLLKHRRLITCKRGSLGSKISNKLEIGKNINCEEKRLKIVDGYLSVLCSYNPEREDNCLEEEDICNIIRSAYKLLPESC